MPNFTSVFLIKRANKGARKQIFKRCSANKQPPLSNLSLGRGRAFTWSFRTSVLGHSAARLALMGTPGTITCGLVKDK